MNYHAGHQLSSCVLDHLRNVSGSSMSMLFVDLVHFIGVGNDSFLRHTSSYISVTPRWFTCRTRARLVIHH